jgi:hypothetical protein
MQTLNGGCTRADFGLAESYYSVFHPAYGCHLICRVETAQDGSPTY